MNADQPARVIVLTVPSCNPEILPVERRAEAERRWQQIIAAVQGTVPDAATLRPGSCAMRARGPTRYYGSEQAAANALLDGLGELFTEALQAELTIGIASGSFAAIQAATAAPNALGVCSPHPNVRIVEATQHTEFLGALPIERAADEALAPVLVGLGIRTLGHFAQLPEQAVRDRFGAAAVLAHRRARGLGEPHGAELSAPTPPRDLAVQCEFEPPLAGVDQLAFACANDAESFVRTLGSHGLVCTELRIELTDDTQTPHERVWSHPSNFTAVDVINRIRWQAAKLPRAAERGGAGIATVRISPEQTAAAATHEPGLWSNAPDEKVHHQLTRVQSLIGHEGVSTGLIVGGRLNTERQHFVPWGSERAATTRVGPWPGQLEGPLPSLVYGNELPVTLLGSTGQPIVIDDDELCSEDPAYFQLATRATQAVHAWSAPWPLIQGWWQQSSDDPRPEALRSGPPQSEQPEPQPQPETAQPVAAQSVAAQSEAAQTVYRLQLTLTDGTAWLLRYTSTQGWTALGSYS